MHRPEDKDRDLEDVSAYDFELPESLIAHAPSPDRARSALLVCHPDGRRERGLFDDVIARNTRPGDVIVFNDTRVAPVRLFARKPTGGAVEVFILEPGSLVRAGEGAGPTSETATALLRASRPVKPGTQLTVPGEPEAALRVDARDASGVATLTLTGPLSFVELLERAGQIPLPPYIRKRRRELGLPELTGEDRRRYQTVYAARDAAGAVAAPTAGLHFTDDLMESLRRGGVIPVFVTLHVGMGTFKPLGEGALDGQQLHLERYSVSPEAAAQLNEARAQGRRIIAVGTTSTRVLEDQAVRSEDGGVRAGEFETRLFIKPGFRVSLTDALITNFHLPRSSLLVLVTTFAGYDVVAAAYREAVASGMRFYSYGDAMLLFRGVTP